MTEGLTENVMSWEAWQATREAKRANLRRLGLDAPSRRETDYGTAGRRLRKAFGGRRGPGVLDGVGLSTNFTNLHEWD